MKSTNKKHARDHIDDELKTVTKKHRRTALQLKEDSTTYLGYDSLRQYGVCVVPLSVAPAELQREFDRSLQTQPELLDSAAHLIEPPFVGGGFGAFGHASSFHNPFCRAIRRDVYGSFKEAIRCQPDIVPTHLRHPHGKIEIIPDRQSFRPRGHCPAAESWHRDLSPTEMHPTKNPFVKSNPGDLILGGWVNCNEANEHHFVCVPGSCYETTGEGSDQGVVDGTGFCLLRDEEKKKRYQDASVSIAIPPGHVLLFDQSTVHCVNSTKLAFDLRRVYIALRLTLATEPLIKDVVERMLHGHILPLKSGQLPRLYPHMWIANWPDRLIEFSEKFPDIMKQVKHIRGKSLKRHKEGDYLVLRVLGPSVPPVPPYTQEELDAYVPHAW